MELRVWFGVTSVVSLCSQFENLLRLDLAWILSDVDLTFTRLCPAPTQLCKSSFKHLSFVVLDYLLAYSNDFSTKDHSDPRNLGCKSFSLFFLNTVNVDGI